MDTSPTTTAGPASGTAEAAPSVPVPSDVAGMGPIAAAVDRRIRTLLDVEIERWRAVDPDLEAPLRSLEALVLAGGKRLRPAFCHWAFVGAGGDPDDPVLVDAGAGLELLHTFALVHDDIMDGSPRRRGMDAVHMQFVSQHRRRSWRGEDRRFGEGVAILVGDLAFVYADLLVGGLPPDAMAVFNELRIEVNIGQYLDLLGTVRGEPTVDSARRICQYKSGKYTIERPLHLGVALAGRMQELAPSLTAYGMSLGEAFQLRDDLLGALGDVTRIGKPVGDDLREGKPTALVALALERSSAAQRDVLGRIGSPDLHAEDIADLQEVLITTGAAAAVQEQILVLRDEAVRAVQGSALSTDAREALVELAHFVTDRDF